MRKILSFISFLFVISTVCNAQSLIIKDVNGTVVSGTMIAVSGAVNEVASCKLKVFNNSSSNIDVKVKKIVKNQIPGSESSFNLDVPYSASVYQSSGFVQTEPGKADTSFRGDYNPNGNAGTTIIRYVFFSKNDKNDSAWVDLAYSGTLNVSQTIEKPLKLSNPYPNPAGLFAKFNYSLPKEYKKAAVEIFDLLGNRVLVQEINDSEGVLEVNTSAINNGIYFYSLVIDDRTVLSRKMVIKH